MSQKASVAAILTLVLLALACIYSDSVVHGETVVDGNPNITLAVASPENTTYDQNSINVTWTINGTIEYYSDYLAGYRTVLSPFFYSGCVIDYNTTDLIYWNGYGGYPNSSGAIISKSGYGYVGYQNVSGLSEGTHNITTWVSVVNDKISFFGYLGTVIDTVSFNVDTTPPNISDVSVEQLGRTDFQLNFTVDKPTSWMGYSLDTKANVTLTGNTTIDAGQTGYHTITVYANDTAGNMGASNTVQFKLQLENLPTPTLTQSPSASVPEFPTWTALAAAVVSIFVFAVVRRKLSVST